MGIQGLLPLLKSIMSPRHLKELEGCCVAVDTYSWLHKGALSCSVQLCKGLPTSRHIDYCMHKVNMLRHYGVKPILVFDGGLLPMKSEQENKRARSRKENLARAIEHESSGNSAAAFECYQKALDISPAIACDLIQVLKKEGVDYIVAPYEADAQMAFLAITQQVDAVITEDSDLIAFGCPRIIYKMDKFGQGVEFQLSMLQHNKDPSFAGFTNDMLLDMCILSGCDYLASLPGMGPKRAYALISKFKTYDKVIKHLRYSSVAVPPDYETLFKKALLTFRHQRVYDPKKEDIVHLTNVPDNIDDELDFLGPLVPQATARAIAKGELDPITKLPFQGGNIQNPASDTCYQLKNYKPESDKKKLDLPAQKNVLTNYFCFASLEAKRKFRAPRVSPKSDLANKSSPTIRKQVSQEGTTCHTNHSPKLLTDPVTQSDVNYHCNSKVINFSPKVMDDLDLPYGQSSGSPEQNDKQSGIPFHKPCLVLRRSRDREHGSEGVPEATNLHVQEATVKSSYLEHKMVEVDENDPNCRNRVVALRSSYFVDRSDDPGSGGRSKKMIVRSSYFKHSKSSKLPRMDEADVQLVKDVSSDGGSDKSHSEELCVKRKASPVHSNSEELVGTKQARTETYVEARGANVPTESKSADVTPGEKFGCNISHLENYSDISGKTMNKLVSAISSFKYNSSGSRASGLRAPLRDVKNLHPRRTPPTLIDIANFAYVPTSSKEKVTRGLTGSPLHGVESETTLMASMVLMSVIL